MKSFEENVQPGCIIRIKKEPAKPKRHGLFLNSEHTIQNPPKGNINSVFGVWIKGRNDELIQLPFWYWQVTPKKDALVMENKLKRKRTK